MGFGGGSKDSNEPTYRKVTVKGDTQRPDPISKSRAMRETRVPTNDSLLTPDDEQTSTMTR